MKALRIVCVLGGFLSLVLSMSAQTFITLYLFDNTHGAHPDAPLVQATDGNLYGTARSGGANKHGTVFEITPSGTLTTLFSFGATNGYHPVAGLIQAADGNFYGTTRKGGANGQGTVFKITPSGTLTTLYSFCSQSKCADGSRPVAALIQAADGNFYGTTSGGGAKGHGTLFEITPNGMLTTLNSFDNGRYYSVATLTQATGGNFYGTASQGGANGYGTVFEITPGGKLTTLYTFCSQGGCTDGMYPSGLIQATSGNFYGTTAFGGATGVGTVFMITPSGTLTTLHSFCSQLPCGEGYIPEAGLVQATDGNFYGTTVAGRSGEMGLGTIFKITRGGELTTLFYFDGTDGYFPGAALIQDTNGGFYGTTEAGGILRKCHNHFNCPPSDGTVFSLSVGFGPFVKTQTTSGNVGAAVTILGTNLTGATSVTFNGTAAKFTVVSRSEIKTTVPTGATTGRVEVTRPKGTLKSNVVFRVTK
jgi:uncharacterized repeat protein (TIGR03803 family)